MIEEYLNKVICGDCLEVMKQLPDKCVDLVLTDPPYKVISGGIGPMNREGQVLAKNDSNIFEYNDIPIEQWLPEVNRIMKDNTQGYIFVNQLNLHHYLDELEKNNLKVHRLLIWNKQIATWTQYYMKCYEFIIFYRKGNAKRINNQSTKDILSISNPKDKLHPTEKPVDLINVLVENSSKENDIIFDPFPRLWNYRSRLSESPS